MTRPEAATTGGEGAGRVAGNEGIGAEQGVCDKTSHSRRRTGRVSGKGGRDRKSRSRTRRMPPPI